MSILLLCILNINVAQTYNMTTGTITTCSGTFYDDGGPSTNYGWGSTIKETFVSSSGTRLQFDFTSLNVQNSASLKIYDGPDDTYPLIGNYGTSTVSVVSTGNSLTFVFIGPSSSSIVRYPGWEANISCTTPTLTPYAMSSGTITACSGVFYDPSGASADYANNSNYTQTYVSGTSSFIHFNFTNFGIQLGDTLFAYDGLTTTSPLIGAYTSFSLPENISSITGNSVTFRFKSNTSLVSFGWKAMISCSTTPNPGTLFEMQNGIRYVCSGTFYDDGGPSINYGWGSTIKQTFVSSSGTRLQFDFTSLDVQNSASLRVYDGPNDTYPLIGIYGTSTVSIVSTGSSLTFVFTGPSSSSIVRYPGWVANISCITPTLTPYAMISGTTTACSGVFFDPAGPATDYANNSNFTQTFSSGSSSFINFNFTNFDVQIGDTLFAYDGNTTSSPLIGAYTGFDLPEIISSLTGSSVTFKFKSNVSSVSFGWKALISCSSTPILATSFNMQNGIRTVCSGTFYDDGGPSTNYGWGSTIKETFVSSSGTRLQFDFTTLNVQNSASLRVYDGPNDTYPLIGTYGTSTVLVVSTGTALTFVFTGPSSSSIVRYPGWVANISCIPLIGAPIANFTTTSFTVCANGCLNFSDLSSSSPNAWLWNFQGASVTTSTIQNPTNVCYNTAGIYTLSLNASNAIGSSSITKTITVRAIPSISITSSNSIICVGQTASLTASGSSTTYTWSTGSNSSVIPVNPTSTSTYSLTGTLAATGCTNNAVFTQSVSVCTNIEVESFENNKVYPNPFKDKIYFYNITDITEVSVINLIGKIIYNVKLEKLNELEINLKDFSAGLYFIKLENLNSYKVIKVLKE